ncbi:MAG: hypothetical protein JEZ02_08860 [Desulfatibacillum sp.]|nr:hypothetical protein [Desulfatibacillum sp.]
MNQKIKRLVLSLVGWAALLGFTSSAYASGIQAIDVPLSGSGGVITGTVTTSFSGYASLPVIGASVQILDIDLRVDSDENGLFVISSVPEQEVTLLISADGLANLTAAVDLGANPVAGGLELIMVKNPPGDANNDGKVGVDDALDILQSLVSP